jgi:predicted nucleotidyltransferase component of viral defense system
VITEGYVVRHYQGRSGGRGPALIDIAQDHLLFRLADQGLFDLGIALKGGTAIRKFWAGSAGRFSTDLDFAGLDDAAAELVLEAVDGAQVGPFGFTTKPIDGTLRVAVLITSPFGSPEVPARLDLGRRPLWLAAQPAQPIALPIHQRYDFTLPPVPAARVEEIVAEKLARFRRTSLARDLYDLAWFTARPFDEAFVRRLTVLKVWCDVVDDGLGSRPFDPQDVVRPRREAEFQPEAIGYLTTPMDIPGWVEAVRRRFGFLQHLDDFEQRVAQCSRADEWDVRQTIAALGADPLAESRATR